jgi:hypothetical protein
MSALPNAPVRFSSVKGRVRKTEPKGSTPQSSEKACCHLGSGRYEEMRRSRGRIRDQRVGLSGKRAESNRPEPTGIECSLTSVDSLCSSTREALAKTAWAGTTAWQSSSPSSPHNSMRVHVSLTMASHRKNGPTWYAASWKIMNLCARLPLIMACPTKPSDGSFVLLATTGTAVVGGG